ncbi:cortex morphogenetic protein CmpA [Aneurinibacillus tyrosinisolvens]|nr:cortex morphogenetic protein CmpA [Aneurinibacillus tyrosinisolvens]
MPHWLRRQLMRAFHTKNRRQILLLNDCWFSYREKQGDRI